MGLSRSAYSTSNTLGPLCLPVGVLPVSDGAQTSDPPTYLLVQASQSLWLVKLHDSYENSLTLTIVSYPNPSPGWNFQERFHLTVSTPYRRYFGALSGRLHTHHGCTMSACFHRIAATGRWVQIRDDTFVEQSIITRLRVAIQISGTFLRGRCRGGERAF